jgi:hypothetical protein
MIDNYEYMQFYSNMIKKSCGGSKVRRKIFVLLSNIGGIAINIYLSIVILRNMINLMSEWNT